MHNQNNQERQNNSIISAREQILAVAAGGAALALSFVLSEITVFRMPMGGSITPASMMPLILYSLTFGPKYGFGACFIMSLMQLIGGYLLFPLQVLLDYILPFSAFGGVSLAGGRRAFNERNILLRLKHVRYPWAMAATVAAYAFRLLCSTLSGVIFYAEYAGEANVWVYSVTYNASFIIPECAITIAVMSVVFALARKAH